MRAGSGRRASLAWEVTVLAILTAVITAVIAGLLTLGLTRSVIRDTAQGTLARIADATAARVEDAGRPGVQSRLVRVLGALGIQAASLGPDGVTGSTSGLARELLTGSVESQLRAGRAVSSRVVLDGTVILVEGRPTAQGGILLVQRRSDATAFGDRIVRRAVLAIGLAAIIVIAIGVLASRRISGPLHRTASAARLLAAGRREVAVPVEGPTEVAEVAAALNALSSSLTRSESRQREFLMSVSHDLRTPLTGIRGYAESLADGLVPVEDLPRVGQVLAGEAARMERFVGDLLDLARLGADRPTLDIASVDLVRVGEEVAAVWGPRCEAVGVRWVYTPRVATAPARTDPMRLRQLLDGLLENALRLTPAGHAIALVLRPGPPMEAGPEWEGRARAGDTAPATPGAAPATPGAASGIRDAVSVTPGRAQARSWVVEVRDGGPGLTDDDLLHAFEPSVLYERYRGVRAVGTGLGLAIVGRLASVLGVRVIPGHAPEGGACFTVVVPQEPGGVASGPLDSPAGAGAEPGVT